MSGKTGVNRRRRRMLYDAQDGKCHYCSVLMVMEVGKSESCTVDHKTPKAHGGGYARHNLVGACWTCNNARGDIGYEIFKVQVAIKGRPVTPARLLRKALAKQRREERKEADRRAKEIMESAAPWNKHMGARRPYLSDVGKHPVFAEAFDAAEREKDDA